MRKWLFLTMLRELAVVLCPLDECRYFFDVALVPRSLRAAYEKITTTPSRSFTVRAVGGTHFDAPYHYHPELELTWIVRSTGHRFVGDSSEPFRAGDLVLLGPHLPHVWLNHAGCTEADAYCVQFLPDFLGGAFFQLPEMRRVQRLLERSARGLVFSPATLKKVSEPIRKLQASEGAARVIGFLEILAHLAADEKARLLSSPRFAPLSDAGAGEKINAIYRHLTASFRETIFQADLARNVGLSPAAFSRFFRRATGRGFTETLNDIRLGHAGELLRETEQTVAEICYASGFENLANFNRQFRRRHGLSPREWRARVGG